MSVLDGNPVFIIKYRKVGQETKGNIEENGYQKHILDGCKEIILC